MMSLVTWNLVRFPTIGGPVMSSFGNLDVMSSLVFTQKCHPFGGSTVMTYTKMMGVGLRCCSVARGTSDST